MKRSAHRILTTHAGSLPRTDKLARLLIERDNDLPVDEAELKREVDSATDWVVRQQLESGVDIGNDGEEARVGFQTYAAVRLSGWGGVSPRKGMTDIVKFPKCGEMLKKRLAFTLVSQFHATEGAQAAQERFEREIQHREVPADIPDVALPPRPSGAGGSKSSGVQPILSLVKSKVRRKRASTV